MCSVGYLLISKDFRQHKHIKLLPNRYGNIPVPLVCTGSGVFFAQLIETKTISTVVSSSPPRARMISLVVLFIVMATSRALNTSPIRSTSMFRVRAAWSLAGVGTSIVVDTDTEGTGAKATRIAFDCGTTPVIHEAFPASTVIISHGHVDHIGGIFNHARAHSVAYGGSTATYYVPAALVSKLEEAREVLSSIDAMNDGSDGSRSESLLSMHFIGVNSGDEIPLNCKKVPGGAQLLLHAFSADHCGHPALGYCIISRKSPGLKAEYQGLPGKEIAALVKSGIQVKGDPVETVEVTYTGDTSCEGIMKREINCNDSNSGNLYRNQAFKAPLILCEATFLDPAMSELAKDRGHMNIDDLPQVLASHGWDNDEQSERKLVLFHVSSRHRPAERALQMMMEHLPTSVTERCDVVISSLISEAERREKGPFIDLVKNNGCISLKEYTHYKSSSQN